VEKEKKPERGGEKKTNISSSDNTELEETSAIKINLFPRSQQPSTLPQSSVSKCSFQTESVTNVGN